MQLKKLSPLAGLVLIGLLSACGGKGDEPPPPAAPPPPPAITVSAITLSATKPSAIATDSLQFEGGVCGGGTGALTAVWDFGDNTGTSSSNTHTYAETATGAKTVTVTCTDTAGTTPAVATLNNLNVLTVAMKGFLGKTWSNYSRIDPTNLSTYPVAGISSSGDISGVWIRRNAATLVEVAAGTSNFTNTSWAVSGTLDTTPDRSTFNEAVSGGTTAVIDQAVSANGHVMAAWKAGTAIWYAKKSSMSGTWSAPAKINVPVTDESIKVVVNDAGDGAIAYCESTGAYVYTYLNNTLGSKQKISNKCDVVDLLLTSTLQRSRAFDIAIDASSKVFAAGIVNATSNPATTTNLAVALKTFTAGAWTTLTPLFADEIGIANAPDSLSLSVSPNGNYAAIVWNMIHVNPSPLTDKSNVHASIYANGVWGASTAVQNDFITKDYTRPKVAINDYGVAFLAMRLKDTYGVKKMEVSNYDAAASTPTWSSPLRPRDYATGLTDYDFQAADIAIDNWGTGLVTTVDSYNTFAGTFSKAGTWSGFKAISPRYPYGGAGSTFHYQSMRALPNGEAIVVTSIYDDQTPITATSQPIPSGYILLK